MTDNHSIDPMWTKLHRDFFFLPVFQKPHTAQIFFFLLGRASKYDQEILFNNEKISLKKGELITSRNDIKKATGLSIQNIRTVLTNLQSNQLIQVYPTRKYSKISITNAHQYDVVRTKGNPHTNPINLKDKTRNNNSDNYGAKWSKSDQSIVQYHIKTGDFTADEVRNPVFWQIPPPYDLVLELFGLFQGDSGRSNGITFLRYYEGLNWEIDGELMKCWLPWFLRWIRRNELYIEERKRAKSKQNRRKKSTETLSAWEMLNDRKWAQGMIDE